jgi:hypothetical protein
MALERTDSDRPQSMDARASTVEVPRPVEESGVPKVGETQDDARQSAKDAARAQFAEATGRAESPETLQRIDELRREGGHGVTRHYDVTDAQQQARLGTPLRDGDGNVILGGNGLVKSENHVDPETGTTKQKDGSDHRCGPVVTRFESAEDFVKADENLREQAAKTGAPVVVDSISNVLSPEAEGRMTGLYIDPTNPDQYRDDVDFTDGKIFAKFEYDNSGAIKEVTMFPIGKPGAAS